MHYWIKDNPCEIQRGYFVGLRINGFYIITENIIIQYTLLSKERNVMFIVLVVKISEILFHQSA